MTDLVLADGRTLDLRLAGPEGTPALVHIHRHAGQRRVPRRHRVRGRRARDAAGVLACAALLPERFRAVASIAGVAPYVEQLGTLDWFAGMGQDNLDEFGAALVGGAALGAYLEPQHEALRGIRAEDVVGAMSSLLPDVDRSHLGGAFGDEIAQSFREAVSVSLDGWVDDDLAFTRAQGSDLAAIDGPVAVWQGSDDLMVQFAHGEWRAAHVPGATAHLLEGDGHLSIGVGRAAETVEDLLARGRTLSAAGNALARVIPPRYHPAMAMTLRLTDEETDILRALAEREHRSMQEVVRLAVLDRAARAGHEAERDDVLDWAEERYAALLDRLSQ